MIIYIILGEAGEYDEYRQWTIMAYIDKKKAEEHKDRLNKTVKEVRKIPKELLNWFSPSITNWSIPEIDKIDDRDNKLHLLEHRETANYFIKEIPLIDYVRIQA